MYATAEDYAIVFSAAEAEQLESGADGRVLSAIERAGAEADSYLATRYQTPVAQPGWPLVQAVLDIARFRLWDARAPEEVRERYKNALTWLQHVASGRAMLAEGTVRAAPASPSIAASARDCVYGGAFEARYTPWNNP